MKFKYFPKDIVHFVGEKLNHLIWTDIISHDIIDSIEILNLIVITKLLHWLALHMHVPNLY